MIIISYNIWFDMYKRIERLESLICSIACASPDVICFQEVIPDTYYQLKNSLTEYEHWYPEDMSKTYGCVTCSKTPFQKVFTCDFSPDTHMARDLIITILKTDIGSICIGNAHFESEFKKHNSNKLTQFKKAESLLNKLSLQTDATLLCADTNICNNEEDKLYFSSWEDCWKCCGDENNMYTYDYQTNNNLNTRNIKYRSRIDRIIMKNNNNFEIKKFSLVPVINDMIEPSDHHGVMVDIQK